MPGVALCSACRPRQERQEPGSVRLHQDQTLQQARDRIVRKGLLWVQQDKLFSRWKERFIILTPEYLQIFKKGSSKLSEMGNFLLKVGLKSQPSTYKK